MFHHINSGTFKYVSPRRLSISTLEQTTMSALERPSVSTPEHSTISTLERSQHIPLISLAKYLAESLADILIGKTAIESYIEIILPLLPLAWTRLDTCHVKAVIIEKSHDIEKCTNLMSSHEADTDIVGIPQGRL